MKIKLAILVLGMSAAVASADSFMPYVGWLAEVGPSFGNTDGIIVSTSAEVLLFNASLVYQRFDSETDDDALRGYLGLGFGPLVQLQLGLGEDGPSGRLKTTLSVNRLLDGGSWKYGYPYFDNYGRKWFSRGLTLSAYFEVDEDDVTGGVQLGVLIF